MTGARFPRVTAALAPVIAVLGVLAVAITRAAEGTSVTVHQCVSGGGFARFGVRLALLHPDDACPQGELALGGDQRQVMGVVVLVAVPVLLGHVAGVLAGVGVLARLSSALRAVLALLVPSLRVPELAPVEEPRLAVEVPVERAESRLVVGTPWRRGPPQVQFA